MAPQPADCTPTLVRKAPVADLTPEAAAPPAAPTPRVNAPVAAPTPMLVKKLLELKSG